MDTSQTNGITTVTYIQICGGPLWCYTWIIVGEAVAPQQVDSVGRGHVQVDVLQVEQDGEQQGPLQVLRLSQTNIIKALSDITASQALSK